MKIFWTAYSTLFVSSNAAGLLRSHQEGADNMFFRRAVTTTTNASLSSCGPEPYTCQPGGCGDCDEWSLDAGCSCASCLCVVAEADPFCKDTQFDRKCVDLADQLCDCASRVPSMSPSTSNAPTTECYTCEDDHTGCGECGEAFVLRTGCGCGDCQDAICTLDPYCCNVMWDRHCAAMALDPANGCTCCPAEGVTRAPAVNPTASPSRGPAPQAKFQQLGEDIDGLAVGDRFGHALAMSRDGTVVAVGAYLGYFSDRGQVRVFQYNGTMWNQMGLTLNGISSSDWFGYSVDLDDSGTILAVGTPLRSWNNAGRVDIYEYDGASQWNSIGAIGGGSSHEQLGFSVSLSGDGGRLVAGAPFYWHPDIGRVFTYQYNGAFWEDTGTLVGTSGEDEEFGWSTDLNEDGSILAIGSHKYGSNDAGRVYVYEYNVSGANWALQGSPLEGEAALDQFGSSLSLSAAGNTLAAGAVFNDGGGNAAGHVRVFSYNGTEWEQMGEDIDGENALDWSHINKLSGDGTTLVVGAQLNDDNGSKSGHIRVYRLNSQGEWQQIGDAISGESPLDEFGVSVAVSYDGSVIAGGAWANDESGADSGHVRVFGGLP